MTRSGVTVVAAVATFALSTGAIVSPGTAVLALAVALLAVIAAPRPTIAAPMAIAAIVLIPVYWGRALGGLGVAVIPITVVGIVLLPTALRDVRRVRLVALDVLVAVYVLLRSLAFVLNYDNGLGAAVGFSSRIVAGYVIFRVLSLIPGVRRRLAIALVVTGALVTVPAALERSSRNWFFDAVASQFQAGAWARPELRFGDVRVEGSFGHPIAFAMFLALVVGIAIALAVSARRGAAAALFIVAAGVSALTLVNTLSRGPLVALVAAVVAWTLIELRRMRPGRVAVLTATFAVLLSFTPALSLVDALWTASVNDTRESRSAEYRLEVVTAAFNAEQFSLLGRETRGDAEEASRAGAERIGLKSIDNEYAIVFVAGGLLSLVAFVAIALLVLRTALSGWLDPVDRAWAIALAAAFANLLTVALLTQTGDLVWVSVAVVASMAQERRDALTAEARRGAPDTTLATT